MFFRTPFCCRRYAADADADEIRLMPRCRAIFAAGLRCLRLCRRFFAIAYRRFSPCHFSLPRAHAFAFMLPYVFSPAAEPPIQRHLLYAFCYGAI